MYKKTVYRSGHELSVLGKATIKEKNFPPVLEARGEGSELEHAL